MGGKQDSHFPQYPGISDLDGIWEHTRTQVNA